MKHLAPHWDQRCPPVLVKGSMLAAIDYLTRLFSSMETNEFVAHFSEHAPPEYEEIFFENFEDLLA